MEPSAAVAFFLLFAMLAIAIRVVAGVMDSDRVKSYIESKGGKLISKGWSPFGNGWSGDKNRIYDVRYEDREGNIHKATVKTSAMAGVYFTEDKIINHAIAKSEVREDASHADLVALR